MYNTSNNPRAALAKERLEARFHVGQEVQDKLIAEVAAMHIQDKLVSPKAMHFSVEGHTPTVHYLASTTRPSPSQLLKVSIHPHALGQMCTTAGIPRTYVNRLLAGPEWERELFSHNLNKLFHNGRFIDRSRNPARFLHRIVNGELRGFLSRNFNRHLASLPLLRGFVFAASRTGARPCSATASSVRFSLSCFLPHVFEPVEGEFVAFGVTWSNSDFGAGRLWVALTTMRISGGTMAVLDDVMSRRHIGSVIQDSDLDPSSETAAKEVDAQVSAIEDVVKHHLSPEAINRTVRLIGAAAEEQIPWHRLRGELGRLLQKTEMEDIKKMLDTGLSDIVDLPPPGRTESGDPIATRWWASNVVSWMASKEQNADRQADLQQVAGGLLSKAKKAS